MMRAIEIAEAGAAFVLRERPIPDPLEVYPGQLIGGSLAVQGDASGTSMDSQDTMHFCAVCGVEPMIETLPLEEVDEAYEWMMSGRARFRMVLSTGA